MRMKVHRSRYLEPTRVDIRSEIDINSLTGRMCEDVEFLQRSSIRFYERPIFPPRAVVDIHERYLAEPRFEEENGFENPF